METLWTNKNFIKVSTVFVVLLCLLAVSGVIGSLRGTDGSAKDIQNTISFTGHGEVKAVADIASFSLTIRQEAKTVKDADAKVAVIEKKVLEFLKTNSVEDKDIKAESVSFSPKYENKIAMPCTQYGCPPTSSVIVGYESYENITVKVRNTDNAGTIKQGLGSLGVENLYGPNFAIDDTDALQASARKLAIDEAKAKAEKLASDLGVRLGKVTSFSEGNNYPVPMMYAKADMAVAGTASAPAQLPKGENTITSDVTITYEIR